MATQVLAWLGLLAVALVTLHWVLDAALRRGTALAAPWRRLHGLLEAWTHPLDGQRRAERRREARVLRARQQREAIARASGPVPLDEEPQVEWDGNVAHPKFGRRSARQHNLH